MAEDGSEALPPSPSIRCRNVSRGCKVGSAPPRVVATCLATLSPALHPWDKYPKVYSTRTATSTATTTDNNDSNSKTHNSNKHTTTTTANDDDNDVQAALYTLYWCVNAGQVTLPPIQQTPEIHAMHHSAQHLL